MIQLGDNDVIRTEIGMSSFIDERTFLVQDLMNGGCRQTSHPAYHLFKDGVACQVLQLQSCTWKTGRIRLALIFEPDEEEVESSDEVVNEEVSPLDEIRKIATEG